MFNPLLADPSTLKNEELENKINDLSKKYHQASRMGNGSVCHQIAIILDTMRAEQLKRSIEMTKKPLTNQNKDLNNLINIS